MGLNVKRIPLMGLTILLWTATAVHANGKVYLNPEQADVKASIDYAVIGTYHSFFEDFNGKVKVDSEKNTIQSVYLEFVTKTITSNCGWCDKIVRSKRLLSSQEYPLITFTSDTIFKDEQGYKVKGVLDLHGVKKEYVLPFDADIIIDEASGEKLLDIKGLWEINRKDFNITWNKLLDKGGVLVGNIITVDWGIKAPILS